jgi:hypothetical protein
VLRVAASHYASAMSQPQISYVLQYVSGMVSFPADPDGGDFLISAQVNFYLVNRGTAFQTAQIQIWTALQNTAPIYEAEVVVSPNTGTSTVVPVSANVVGTLDQGWANQWTEIRTTSPDLVPSCAFYTAPNAAASGQTPLMFYFAPGDFARFSLQPVRPAPPGPPTPPIAP